MSARASGLFDLERCDLHVVVVPELVGRALDQRVETFTAELDGERVDGRQLRRARHAVESHQQPEQPRQRQKLRLVELGHALHGPMLHARRPAQKRPQCGGAGSEHLLLMHWFLVSQQSAAVVHLSYRFAHLLVLLPQVRAPVFGSAWQ